MGHTPSDTAADNNNAELYAGHLREISHHYLDAAKAEGKSGVVIASGSLKTAFLDDHTYPFKVNPHFKALVPITQVPDSFVVLREGEKPQLLFHQPEDYWHMTPETPTGYWVDQWDITPITQIGDAHNYLGDSDQLTYIGEETDIAAELSIADCNNPDLLNPLHYQRAYKTDYEIACLKEASRLASLGHRAAKTAFDEGASEFAIQQAYLASISHREHETPYSNIVALNEHCAVLHYQFYEHKRFNDGERKSMLIDAGANYQGYAADVTRTYAAEPGLFMDLIAAVDEAQLGIIADIEVGMDYATLHEKMHVRLADILQQHGLVDMSVAAMLETNLTFTFLPHGLGHFLGLQTHDVGGFQQSPKGDVKAAPDKYPALRLTRTIENKQVFTIEPGLYFIPMLLKELKGSAHASAIDWDKIDKLLPFGGIRIEDNIAMINNRAVNLTREAFAQL
jgi:Xaa-Pro dipeptidase